MRLPGILLQASPTAAHITHCLGTMMASSCFLITQTLNAASPRDPHHFPESSHSAPGTRVSDFFPCASPHEVQRGRQEEGWVCRSCHQVRPSHSEWAGRDLSFVLSVMKPEAKTKSGCADLAPLVGKAA